MTSEFGVSLTRPASHPHAPPPGDRGHRPVRVAQSRAALARQTTPAAVKRRRGVVAAARERREGPGEGDREGHRGGDGRVPGRAVAVGDDGRLGDGGDAEPEPERDDAGGGAGERCVSRWGRAITPTAWRAKRTAVMVVMPCRRAKPVVMSRPVTDRMPSRPDTVAATVAGVAQLAQAVTSSTPTTETAAAWATNAAASSQNVGLPHGLPDRGPIRGRVIRTDVGGPGRHEAGVDRDGRPPPAARPARPACVASRAGPAAAR